MADQKSTDAALTPAIKTYYEKKILESFEPQTRYASLAPVTAPIPMGGGKTIEFTRYKKIAPKATDDSSELSSTQTYLSAEIVSATIHERSNYVQLSTMAVLTSINNALTQAVDKIQEAAVKAVDVLVRDDIGMMVADVANASSLNYGNMAINGGTLNSTGKTARVWSHDRAAAGDRFPMYHNKTRLAQSSLVTSFAKSAMTVKTLQHGVQVLASKDIPTLPNGNYNLITHPFVAYQITTSAGFKGWMSPTSSDPMKKSPVEVGVVAGVSIFQSTQAYKFSLSADTMSTASGALYCSLLFGKEAYGVSEISGNGGRKGFEFFLKESGPQSTNDPANKVRTAAYAIRAVAKILNKSAGLWLLTTEQV